MALGIEVKQQQTAGRQYATGRRRGHHAHRLQAPVVLVGPETGDRVKSHFTAQQIQRRMPPLRLGVTPGFLALILAPWRNSQTSPAA